MRSGPYIPRGNLQKRFEEQFLQDDERRQRLLDALIDLVPLDDKEPPPEFWSQPLPTVRDIPHLLHRLSVEPDALRRQLVARAIDTTWCQQQKQEVFDIIAQAWKQSVERTGPSLPELEQEFNQVLRPISLTSKEAQGLRTNWRQQEQKNAEARQFAESRRQKQHFDPPLDEQIETSLVMLEERGLDAWIRLNYLLAFEPDGALGVTQSHDDLTKFPGWKRASNQTQARLLNGARAFLSGYEPHSLERVEELDAVRANHAGYRALRLLLTHNQREVEALPPSFWARWSTSIVFFPDLWKREEQISVGLALMLAYRYAPGAVLEAFKVRLERDGKADNPTGSLRMLEGALDDSKEALQQYPALDVLRPLLEGFWRPSDAFCAFLIEHMKRPDWEPAIFGVWLGLLLKREVPEADAYARHLVATAAPVKSVGESEEADEESKARRERAVVAAELLLSETADGGWSVVWPAFQRDCAFGCAVVERLAPLSRVPSARDLTGLSERQLAEFYFWLETEFPQGQDPDIEGVHRPGTREFVGQYRNEVLSQLARRKTPGACREIELLIEKLPEATFLDDTLRHARELMGREQWQPMEPAGVLALREQLMTKPEIAIATVLSVEHEAMEILLDDPKPYTLPGPGAGRSFTLGTIPAFNNTGQHQIVLAQLVKMNNTISAASVTQLLERFPSLKYVIMCGIAGGVPQHLKAEDHVRLGDAVLCDDRGVIEYDFGKETLQEGRIVREIRATPKPPGAALVEATNLLMRGEEAGRRPWLSYIERIIQTMSASEAVWSWERPGDAFDVLLDSRVLDRNRGVEHPADRRRREGQPRLFRGLIASSNFVQGNPQRRDELRDQFKVKAIEMEGSGVAEATWLDGNAHFMVVRGVCDYCDARNKGDDWHPYAAAVAAAFTRALLEALPVATKTDSQINQ